MSNRSITMQPNANANGGTTLGLLTGGNTYVVDSALAHDLVNRGLATFTNPSYPAGSVAFIAPRTTAQLAGAPPAEDVAAALWTQFEDKSDPSKRYTVNAAGTAYVPTAASPVTVSGSAGIGNILTATLATGWSATAFQWLRDGVAIAGATSSTYQQVLADVGHTITPSVTGLAYVAIGVPVPGIAPAFASAAVIGPVIAGGAVNFTAPVVGIGSPAPAVTNALYKNGALISASYTSGSYSSVVAGDSLQIVSTAANGALPNASIASVAVTVTATPTTFAQLGLYGVNAGTSVEYEPNAFYLNMFGDARGYGVFGTTSQGGVALDGNGYPTGPSSNVISASPDNGLSVGQTPLGTYHYRAMGTGTDLTVNGATISNLVQSGAYYTCDITVTGTTFVMNWASAVSQSNLPRDGSYPTANPDRTLNPRMVAHFAQFVRMRTMDYSRTNGREDVNWSDRVSDSIYPCASFRPSWEQECRWLNAIHAAPGSKMRYAWINLPGKCVPDYATQLSALFNANLSPSILIEELEYGNERWNADFDLFIYDFQYGVAQAQVMANYAIATPNITSIVGNGTTATVTFTGNASSYPYLVNNAAVIVAQDTQALVAGSPSAPVHITYTGGQTYTFPSTLNGALSGNVGIYFNVTSQWVADGVDWSLFNIGYKTAVNLTKQMAAAWAVNRPQDKWLITVQTFGTGNNGFNQFNARSNHWDYAKWLGGGNPASFLTGGIAHAPYTVLSSTPTTVDAAYAELNADIALGGATYNRNRLFLYTAYKYGLIPKIYEVSIDQQNNPALIVGVNSDPRRLTFEQIDAAQWFQMGGSARYFFSADIGPNTNTAQGEWSVGASDYGQTSQKLQALLTFSAPITYGNLEPLSSQKLLLSENVSASYLATGEIDQYSFYLYSNANPQYFEKSVPLPSNGTYTIWINGTEAVGHTTAIQIFVDDVAIGSTTLSQTGGGSAGTNPLNPSTSVTFASTAGYHRFRFYIPAGVGYDPGMRDFDVTYLHA